MLIKFNHYLSKIIYKFIVILFFLIVSYNFASATTRLISMNIHCLNDNWRFRTEEILNKFIELKPEVVSLQEVCIDRKSGENQIEFINNYLLSRGYPLIAIESQYTHQAWGQYDEYLVIFTSKKITHINKGYLPQSLLQRAFLSFLIEGTWYINTHLEYRNIDIQIRRDQLDFLSRQFEWWPHVLMGDFNSSPKSFEQQLLHDKKYFPFFPDNTFIGTFESFDTQIDGFWFDPKMTSKIKNIQGYAFLKEQYENKHLSDHLAVFVNYEWR